MLLSCERSTARTITFTTCVSYRSSSLVVLPPRGNSCSALLQLFRSLFWSFRCQPAWCERVYEHWTFYRHRDTRWIHLYWLLFRQGTEVPEMDEDTGRSLLSFTETNKAKDIEIDIDIETPKGYTTAKNCSSAKHAEFTNLIQHYIHKKFQEYYEDLATAMVAEYPGQACHYSSGGDGNRRALIEANGKYGDDHRDLRFQPTKFGYIYQSVYKCSFCNEGMAQRIMAPCHWYWALHHFRMFAAEQTNSSPLLCFI